MTKRSHFFPALVASGMVAVALTSLAWAAWTVDAPTTTGPNRAPSWETAQPRACPLMAQALVATGYRQRPDPLMKVTGSAGPCDWSQWGLAPKLLTQAEFDASTRSDPMVGYIPHVSLTVPRYSFLQLRAAVEVGYQGQWESGFGEVCYFRRALHGWRLQHCRGSWVS